MDTARMKGLREQLNVIFEEAGPDLKMANVKSLDGTEAEKSAKVKKLNDELAPLTKEYEELERRQAEQATEDGHPLPEGHRYGRKSSIPARKGWKAGTWAEPFMKELSQISGTKGLISSGTVTVPSLTGGIVPIEDRPQSLLQVVPVEGLSETDTYAYLREETHEHKAAETGKGKLKPTSVYKVKKIEGSVKTIAHVSEPIARQDLEDTSLLRGYIDGNMARGVQQVLESQILSGKGENEELTGIAKVSGIQTQAFSSNILTSARKGLTKLEEKQIPNGVYVVGTKHWEAIELLQESDGDYLGRDEGLPVDRMRKQLWGQPVITTTLLSGKLGYLVDFAGSTKLFERGGIRVDWSEAPVGSESGKSAFLTNELIFRGEGRWGFGVTRPAGVVEIGLEA
jgi:HK97 family phage major capsid protein